jgi:heat shock protein HslJ
LYADSFYSLKRTFESKGDPAKPNNVARVEIEEGAWGFSSDRRVLVLKSNRDGWSWFAIPAPGVLRAVDAHGESIGLREPWDLERGEWLPGLHAARPSAGAAPRSVTVSLSDVEWKLTELQNKPLRPATKGKQDILLAFDEDDNTFSGQSACNPLEGMFEAGARTITITPRKPLRVCRIDDGTERALSGMIKDIRTYRITGTTLDFFDERGGRIGRFEGRK